MNNAPPLGQLRPFVVQTDLGELAELIQVAFGEELRRTGNRMVEDLRQMARLGPLIGLTAAAWPLYTGYVWAVEGHVVGNVTVAHERDRGEWQLSNVAVLPEWRGQGIASRLVDAALAHLRANHAERVYLQVRHDNAVAQTIYTQRGFRVFDTVQELGLRASAWPLAIGGAPGLQGMGWRQSRHLAALASVAIPMSRLEAQPHLLSHYHRGFWQALGHALDLADHDNEYAALSGGELIGWGRLHGQAGRPSAELELLVHPAARGHWESALVTALLAQQYVQRSYLRAHVSETHPEAATALRALGFELLRVLDEMVLAL